MPKGMPKRADELQTLEGGIGGVSGGGGRGIAATPLNPRPTGTRLAKDYKESERESELSGRVDFGRPRSYDYGDRTPRTSDDYKKGGAVSSASRRADGIAQKGKTKGRYV